MISLRYQISKLFVINCYPLDIKMPSPFIGGRIPQGLHEALQNHIAESGEKLPQILQKALSNYLSYTPSISSSTGLEERIISLEASFKSLKEEFEQIKQNRPLIKTKEEENIPPGQLSLLGDDIKPVVETDIKETNDIKPVVETDSSQENNLDNKVDIVPDINKDNAKKQLETITPQELAEREGMAIQTLRNYHSTKREVKKGRFIYRPVPKTEKGKPMWSVETIV